MWLLRWGIVAVASFFLFALPAMAQRERAQLWCEEGGQTVTTNGIVSSTKVQKSYPSCTVTVFDNGTNNLTQLCSDAACTTQLINPFTSTATGYITFFAQTEPHIVDVQQTGAGLPTAITTRGLELCDIFTCLGGGGGGGGTVAGTPPHIAKFTSATAVGNSVGQDDGTTPVSWPLGVSLETNALFTRKTNNATMGTTLNLLVARDSAGNAINAQPTDTNNLIGICGVGIGTACGTSGNASIAYSGEFPCVFDNQTAFNDWVVLGSASQCHDIGAIEPPGVQNIGRVASVNGGVGTLAIVDLGLPDVTGAASAGNGVVGPCNSFAGPLAYYTAIQTLTCDALLTTDGAGGLSGKSVTLTGANAGFIAFGQGATPTFCPTGAPNCVPVNSSAWHGPTTVTTAFDTAVPSAPGTVGQALVIATAPDGTHITTAWSSVGAGNVTSFSSGNLSPLFTTSVATATTTPALSFTLSTAAANTVFGNDTGSTAAPHFFTTPFAQCAATSTMSCFFDDFFYGENGTNTTTNGTRFGPWVFLNQGVANCSFAPMDNSLTVTTYPGQGLLTNTTGGPGDCYFIMGGNDNAQGAMLDPRLQTFKLYALIGNRGATGLGTEGQIRFGLFNDRGTQNDSNYVWFQADSTGTNANWFCRQADQVSGASQVDSGIVSGHTSNSSPHLLEIDASATSTVVYKIDGVQVCAGLTTNLPNGRTFALGVEAQPNGSGTGAIDIDYVRLDLTVSR